MIIRKIKPSEIKRTGELFAIAFEFGSDETRSAEEIYTQAATNPLSREDLCWQERWAAFEDDDTTMMSFFVAKPMPVHFDGNHCSMTGIGGVATLPQYRRRGGIRACFEAALPDMYDNGIAFSYLYPFSTAYYRKFGYEMCCQQMNYQVKLEFIPSYPAAGSCQLCEPGNILAEDIRSIYSYWQKRYNMMIENEDFEFAWIAKSNPVKDQIFTYVYKDPSGLPKAFATFAPVTQDGEKNLVCSRFFFTDAEGLQGILLLAKSFASDHHAIVFDLPTDQDISPLLPEWSMDAVKRELFFHGMARVIRVEDVLRMARYQGSGKLVIDITDPYIPQNNNRFQVVFTDGKAEEVSITDAQPDISLGIGDFSRLIIGAFHPDMLPYCPAIRLHTDWSTLSKAFYPKPCYITEYF